MFPCKYSSRIVFFKYTSGLNPRIVESPSSGVCTLVKAADVGLKRGRCHLCISEKARAEQKYTVYACSVCKVRLCVIDCFAHYHAVRMLNANYKLTNNTQFRLHSVSYSYLQSCFLPIQ